MKMMNLHFQRSSNRGKLDIGIRQEGCSLGGNIQLPHICVKMVH